MAALRILLLTFTSRFVIIIFSAIATDDRHPPRSRSIHQNAANCMTIRFRYIAHAHTHVMMFDALPVGRTACMPSKKIMESLRTFVVVETVLRRGRMFQGSDKV